MLIEDLTWDSDNIQMICYGVEYLKHNFINEYNHNKLNEK